MEILFGNARTVITQDYCFHSAQISDAKFALQIKTLLSACTWSAGFAQAFCRPS